MKCLVPPGRARLKPMETQPSPEFPKRLSYPNRSSTEYFKRFAATTRRGQGLHVKGAEEMRAVAIGMAGSLAFPMPSGSLGRPKAKKYLLLLKNFDLWQSRRAPTGGPIATTPIFSAAHRAEVRALTVLPGSSVREEALLPAQLPQLAFSQHRYHHQMHAPESFAPPRAALPQPCGERPVVPLCRVEVPAYRRNHDVTHRP